MRKKKAEVVAQSAVPTMHELIVQAREENQELINNFGELTPELEKKMELTKDTLSKKTDGYFFRLEDLEGQLEMLKGIKKQADKGIKMVNSSMDFLNTRMKNALEELGVKQILGNYSKFSMIRTKQIVQIVDETLLPATYLRTTELVEIDKQKIGEDLKAGKVVPGAVLVENEYLERTGNNIKTIKDVVPVEGGQ